MKTSSLFFVLATSLFLNPLVAENSKKVEWVYIELKSADDLKKESISHKLDLNSEGTRFHVSNQAPESQIQAEVRHYIEDRSSGSWNIDSSLIKGRNGGRGPGGGDGIYCSESSSHSFKGWYSYDFIQSRSSLSEPLEKDYSFANQKSCSDYMAKISERLKVLNPLLATGLEHYLDSSPFGKQEQVFGIKREWKALKLGDEGGKACFLFDLKDETANVTLENCQKCQLFIRKYSQSESKIFYLYHEAQLNRLMQRPRQCSYAVIHEWARDFLPDSQDLYDFVGYLHSDEFFTSTHFKYVGLTDDPKKRMFKQQGDALKNTSLELYFKMASQVPAAPGEVKEFQENFLKQFQDVVIKIEEELVILERVSKKDPFIPDDLHLTGKAWLEDIRYKVRTKQITLGKAFQELMDLQASIPIMKGAPDPMNNPFFRRMMFSPPESADALSQPWNKFKKDE
jgi:hypothetical protein